MPDTVHDIERAVHAHAIGPKRTVRLHLPALDRRVLTLLLALDGLLIGAHVLAGLALPRIPPFLHISLDFSLAEWVGYAKWLLIVLCLVAAWQRCRCAVLLPLAGIFCVMLLDDSMQLHEGLGRLLAEAGLIPAQGLLHEQDLGELLAFGILALPLLPALALGWVRSGPHGRRMATTIMVMIAILSVFGGVIDALHPLVPQARYTESIAHLVEDGGEMIVASFILAHAVAIRASVMAAPAGPRA